MSRSFLALFCGSVLALCALFSARGEDDVITRRLRLIDARTKQPRPGIVRLRGADGKAVVIPGALPRLLGVKVAAEFDGWHVVPLQGLTISLPPGKYAGKALAGLETLAGTFEVNVKPNVNDELKATLEPCFDPADHGLVAGNTHLHLMKITKQQAEAYLRQVPPADNLRVMFLSYLQRFKDDAGYVTNTYPVGDLPDLSKTGVLWNNGQEHRHNIAGYGEGYGHVMFLDIKQLVKPVSLGPGITGAGFDDRPLRPGIEEARGQGGTIIWCHNAFGTEDVPSAITGQLHALNVFDGSRRGSFDETYYRYLNIGIRLPISTGTDWFIYDFARVYAKVNGELTIKSWLDALKAGRNSISNGPLLTLTVDGKECGAVLNFDQPRKVKVAARAVGRHDFTELQLIHNGKVVRGVKAKNDNGRFRAVLETEVRIDAPGWLAAGIASATKNELGHQLFAHTSPVYLDYAGKRPFDIQAAQALLRQLEDGHALVAAQAKFSTDAARTEVLKLYDDAAERLRERLNGRTK
jgi:hypothetical protein